MAEKKSSLRRRISHLAENHISPPPALIQPLWPGSRACQTDRGSANPESSYSHAGLLAGIKSADFNSLTASASSVHAGAHHRAAAVANRHRHARAARITRLWAAHGLANRGALLSTSHHRSCHCGAAKQPIAAGTTARGIEDQNSHCDKQQSLFHHLHCPHEGDAPFTWFA